jgi:hypothetical protein
MRVSSNEIYFDIKWLRLGIFLVKTEKRGFFIFTFALSHPYLVSKLIHFSVSKVNCAKVFVFRIFNLLLALLLRRPDQSQSGAVEILIKIKVNT